MSRIGRRSLLGAAAALAGTALLPRTVWAGPSMPPKRLVFVFTGVGTQYPNWVPSGTENNWTLSPILQPFAPFKDRMIVLDGINNECAKHGDGDDHMKGMGSMLTGMELLPGTVQGGGGTPAGMGGGISVDQAIANVVGTTTTYKSLEFGAYVKSSDVWSRMIYAGANQPLPPMEDPLKTFNRLFSTSMQNPADAARLLRRRQSVLDQVQGTLKTLEGNVGADDRQRVQAHLQSVQQIEKQILSQTVACAPPVLGAPLDLNDINNYPAVGKMQMDMLVTSLSCDLTRIASMQFAKSSNSISFPWLGIADGHHDLSHMGDLDTVSQNKLVQINNWYASQIAYMLGKMDAIQEGNGMTLLDNSLVVWVNELAKGNVHSHMPTPIVMFGSARGTLKTNRYIKFAQPALHQNLLTSIANVMDVPLTTFGNPAYCTGTLSGL
jgi:hypothetical protein